MSGSVNAVSAVGTVSAVRTVGAVVFELSLYDGTDDSSSSLTSDSSVH